MRWRAARPPDEPIPFATISLRAGSSSPDAARSPMSAIIDTLERAQLRTQPQFDPGDRVRVHFQVIEGTRRRTQVFEGVVLKRQGSGARETFTVRKQSFGVGVERTFPLHSPKIERIEVAARGDVRRAKLYYLRGRVGRRARVRERQDARGAAAVPAAGPQAAQDPDPLMDEAGTLEEAESSDGPSDEVATDDAGTDEGHPEDAGTDESAAADEGSAS